jgi:hypothetical protein
MTDVTITLRSDGSSDPVELITGESHTLAVISPVTMVRFFGPMFAAEKCFVRQSALRGIRDLRKIYVRSIGGEVLVIGHSDAPGGAAGDMSLSLGRARSLAAFLTEDVDAWMDFFGDDPPAGKTWGIEEIVLMLRMLPREDAPYFTNTVGAADAIAAFEADHGMQETGEASESVLRAIIEAYMHLDGTPLPPETKVIAHGCGEAFPLGGDPARDRRIEVILFHRQIDPEPAGEMSTDEYEEWLEAITEEHQLGVDEDRQEYLELRLHDESRKPMARTRYRVIIGKERPIVGTSGHDGRVFIALPAFCPEFITVQWGEHDVLEYAYDLEVIPECSSGDGMQQDAARLHNLGYAPLVDLEAAVRQFQIDYGVDHDPILGLVAGELPPATRALLTEIWEERELDASK